MLSAKQGCIKYHFLSLWYDTTWERTSISWTIGECSNHYPTVNIELNKIYRSVFMFSKMLSIFDAFNFHLSNFFYVYLFIYFSVAVTMIGQSNDLSPNCHKFAILSLCYHAFPLCDTTSSVPKPRLLCKDECRILREDICRMEYKLAKVHPLIGKNSVLFFIRNSCIKWEKLGEVTIA